MGNTSPVRRTSTTGATGTTTLLLIAPQTLYQQQQQQQQQRHKSVFVSKHNQSLQVTSRDILDYCASHGLISSFTDHSTTSNASHSTKDYRLTSSHVILCECPFCSKPTHGKADNQFKCYISHTNGAYFCHRCGAGGSWFDWKLKISGPKLALTVDPQFYSTNHYNGDSTSTSTSGSTSGDTTNNNYYSNRNNNAQQQMEPATTNTSQYARTNNNNRTSSKTNTTTATPSAASSSYSSPERTLAASSSSTNSNNNNTTAPLPMPSPRLQALYSTQLLDQARTNKTNNRSNNNAVLDYLLHTRGLTAPTLRKYGVGQAQYAFMNSGAKNSTNSNTPEWVEADCVTFPWMQSVAACEYQEQVLRGSNFVWDGLAAAEAELQARLDQQQRHQQKLDKKNAVATDPDTPDAKKRGQPTKGAATKKLTKKAAAAAAAAVAKESGPVSNTQDVHEEEEEALPMTIQEVKEQTFVTRRIKVRSVDRKDWQRMDPPGGGWGLFGFHTVPAASTEIILTEGEYDAMAVYQATGRPAVSLPNGCRSLPVEVLPMLEEFTKIVLWMDNDAAGQEGAAQFAKKLGLERTFIVRPTIHNCHKLDNSSKNSSPGDDGDGDDEDEEEEEDESAKLDFPKDANEALLRGFDLERIIVDAKRSPHESIVHFSDLRMDVLHEIMHPDKYVGIPVTSLPGFTNIIKGLRRGELTVLTGPTGSGKTTFLGQVSLDLVEQDVNVLWGSFEIKNTRLMHKLLQQFSREPLPTGDPSMAPKLEALADRFEKLPFSFMKFHGGSDVDDILDAMDYAVYVNDVEHIILDNMQFMVSLKDLGRGSTFDKFDVQDVAIEKFRKFATDRNVHVTLVVHPKKEAENTNLSISSIYGSAKATQEADTVLILQNDGRRKFLEVKKNRFNGNLGLTPLHFDRQSGRYGETPIIDVKSSANGNEDRSPAPDGGSAFNNTYSKPKRFVPISTEPPVDPWESFINA